jgi:triosephosphate isomerase (TIM)
VSARKKLVAGNWKMQKTVREAQELVRELRRLLSVVREVEIAIAPPYTALWPVGRALEDSNIALAGQDLFWEDQGAFTGAVSGTMLAEAGCRYALVGHSERRQLFGETLESSKKRVAAAFKHRLIPILCVGETLAEREANKTMQVVGEQLDAGLAGASAEELQRIVIAYEPVWAIGTGKVATPAQAQEVHAFIRERLRSRGAAGVRVLYGGSVKPENAAELMKQPDIDGALVGGASLDAAQFAAIVKAA